MDTVLAAGKYLSWGVVSISVTNLMIILTMIVVFVLALVIPFPHARDVRAGARSGGRAGDHPDGGA